MNNATTIRIGMIVHANSTWLLPYTWGGSRPSSFFLFLNFTTEQSSKLKTTRKMAPVTASTNRDSPKIDFAGVEAGAKIFVGLKGWAVSAKAAAAPQMQTTTCEIRTRQLLEPRDRNSSPYFRGNGSELESEFLHQSPTY
jgi:hypothetical protein